MKSMSNWINNTGATEPRSCPGVVYIKKKQPKSEFKATDGLVTLREQTPLQRQASMPELGWPTAMTEEAMTLEISPQSGTQTRQRNAGAVSISKKSEELREDMRAHLQEMRRKKAHKEGLRESHRSAEVPLKSDRSPKTPREPQEPQTVVGRRRRSTSRRASRGGTSAREAAAECDGADRTEGDTERDSERRDIQEADLEAYQQQEEAHKSGSKSSQQISPRPDDAAPAALVSPRDKEGASELEAPRLEPSRQLTDQKGAVAAVERVGQESDNGHPQRGDWERGEDSAAKKASRTQQDVVVEHQPLENDYKLQPAASALAAGDDDDQARRSSVHHHHASDLVVHVHREEHCTSTQKALARGGGAMQEFEDPELGGAQGSDLHAEHTRVTFLLVPVALAACSLLPPAARL